MTLAQNSPNGFLMALYLLVLLCLASNANAQQSVTSINKFKSGISVVEVNASFNISNAVSFLPALKDCKTYKIDIDNAGSLKVKTVPTIIVFDNGKEKKRYEANIMMRCEAKLNDIQNTVNNIQRSKFE